MGSANDSPYLSYVLIDVPQLATLAKSLPELAIVTKSHPKFQELRHGFNHSSTTPSAVIRPRHEDDVVATLKHCSEAQLVMTIRSGGHDLQHRPALQDAVVVDLRRLDTVQPLSDTSSGSISHAVIGGGASSRQVMESLEKQQMMTPTGWCPDVGYVGWAAGGGYGFYAPFHGMGADQILGARIATPDGTIVDTDNDSELLWAVRGAGLGNFGVVLELRVKVYPLPKVIGGFIVYPFTEAKTVLESFNEMCEEGIPRRLAGELSFANDGLAAVICMYYHWILDGTSENAQQGQYYLEKYRAFGTVLMDTVTETTSSTIYNAMDAQMPASAPHFVESLTVASLSPEIIDVLVANPPVPHSALVLHNAHGKVLEENVNAIFNMRKQEHMVLCFSYRQEPGIVISEEIAKNQKWPSVVHSSIRAKGLAMARSYQSFTPNEHCHPVVMFGQEGVERLRRLKEKYNQSKAFPASYPEVR